MKQLRHTLFIAACAAWSLADPASALTSQELCERVYEQYGLRSEGCLLDDDENAPPATQTLNKPSQEMNENHIFFASGGVKLDPQALTQISVLTQVLQTPLMQDACLRLVGHSDSSGSATRNQQIAFDRANAVAVELRKGLQNKARIREVLSEGEERALSGFTSTSPYNRRVEIFAKTCD